MNLRRPTIPVMCTAEKTTMAATASAIRTASCLLAPDTPDDGEQSRGQQDDDEDARHVPEQGFADVVDAAAAGDVIGCRPCADQADHDGDRRDRGIDQPVLADDPAQPTARPGGSRFIPRWPVLIPNRLRIRPIGRILDVGHEFFSAFGSPAMMQQTISQPTPVAPERRVDLDWVRIGAFGLLILYHVGMFYVSWDWHIKSAQPVAALEPLMLVLNPWRLALLFLVSGVATRFMLRKTAAGALLRARSSRLLDPARLRHARDRAAAGLYPDRRGARLFRRLPRLLPARTTLPSAKRSAQIPASSCRPGTICGSWPISGSTPWRWAWS